MSGAALAGTGRVRWPAPGAEHGRAAYGGLRTLKQTYPALIEEGVFVMTAARARHRHDRLSCAARWPVNALRAAGVRTRPWR
jgi:hypothetical protein